MASFFRDVQGKGPTSFPKVLTICCADSNLWCKEGCEIDFIVELIVQVDVPISQPFFPTHISLLVPHGWIIALVCLDSLH